MPMYEDVRLQAVSLEHADVLYRLTHANRRYLRRWLPWLDQINSVQDEHAFILNCMELAADAKLYAFVIIYKGEVCGVVSCHDIDSTNRKAAIGYWLSEYYSGKGIVTEAVKRLVLKGFGDYGLNRIEIFCAVENLPSRAIPERLGFRFEGINRQREWLYTRFVDHAVYALTRDQRDKLV